jgi:hypothetical protein
MSIKSIAGVCASIVVVSFGAGAQAQPASAPATPVVVPATQPASATTVPAKAAPAKAAKPAAATASGKAPSKASGAVSALSAKVDVLTEEVQRLKEKLVLPDKEEFKGQWGLGPAASRIYRTRRGLAVGGYGEFHLELKARDKRDGKDFDTGDMLRYVQYVGYKFTDKLLINVELEFEHGTTSGNWAGRGGSVSVEFASLEYLAHRMFNVRAGVLLVPMGFINELHEPAFFHGNLRPAVETRIIPTTWRELGVGVFGELFPGFTYKLYGLTGFDGLRFGEGGWRGGRQKGGRPIAEDFAVVGALTYDWRSILLVGASFYYGGADQSRVANDASSNTLMLEARAQLRWRGIEFRALGVYTSLSGAEALTQTVYPDSGDPAAPETRVIGSRMFGWYVEGAYDVLGALLDTRFYLAPYVRVEQYDTQAKVPTIAGRAADPGSKKRVIEAGLTFKPHAQVVVKAGYRDVDSEGTSPVDSFFVGAGFVY